MTVTTITDAELAPKDYASDQEVRWCPGCGDYAILKAVQKALAELGARRERTVFVSGIGCAARFPYYLSTYGFQDRKSTRLNSSHSQISYAVFCLKKKKNIQHVTAIR